MADFKTHITVSSALGVGYGAAAYHFFGVPAPTCVLAGTLCGVSGMLPDLDSDSGVPLRESLAFAAACVPMLLIDRFRHLGWTLEIIVLAGAGVYAAIRFGVGALLKKYTVHRGMFHSIPAMLIAGEIAFLLCTTGDFRLRAYKAGAVMLGFLSHLVLDEIWSIKVSGRGIGLKSSSGTALKLFSSSMWANLSAYTKLGLFGLLVFRDPIWSSVSPETDRLHTAATEVVKQVETKTNLQLPDILTPRASATTAPSQSFQAPVNQPNGNGPPTFTPNTQGAPNVAPGYIAPRTNDPRNQSPYSSQPQLYPTLPAEAMTPSRKRY